MKYLLDTNIASYSVDQQSPYHHAVIARLCQLADDDIAYLSVLTLYETEYGVLLAPNDKRDGVIAARDLLQSLFPTLPVTAPGSSIFARLKAGYRTSTGIGDKALDRHNIDFLIASCALVENAILVSNDSIFTVIHHIEPELRLENWAL